MPNVPISPPGGLMLNGTDYEAQGRWRLANLVRFFRGSPQPVGGWTGLVLSVRDEDDDFALRDSLDGVCRGQLSWRDNDEVRWTAFGTTRALYAHNGSELFDITPSGFTQGDENTFHGTGFGAYLYDDDEYGTERSAPITQIVEEPGAWSLDTWGENLIASPNWTGIIYEWVPGAAAALVVTGAAGSVPEKNRSVLVSNERHLVAIGAGEWNGATWDANKRRVAWSTAEDNDDWIPTLVNSAGDLPLQTAGIAVTGVKFRNEILIWTDIDMHRMSYIGAPFYYGIKPLSSAGGTFSINAHAVTSNFIFWVGPNGFQVYDGAVRDLAPDVWDYYKDDVNRDQVGKICCGHNPQFKEIWTFYPSRLSSEIDTYVLWNYESNEWSVGQLSRTSWDEAAVWGKPIATKPVYIEESTVVNQDVLDVVIDTWTNVAATTRVITGLVVKDSTGATTYVEGVDYDEWMAVGRFRTLTGGAIADGADLKISYIQPARTNSIAYNHEDDYTDDGVSRSIWVRTAPFEISLGDQLAVVRKIIQDTGREDDLDPLLNSDAVQIYFYTRLAPEGPVIEKGPYTLDTVRGYTDARFTGRQVVMEVRQVKNELWRIGKYRLDIVPGSGR